MIEIYKDIKGYKGIYQVSNLGNVRGLGNSRTRKEKILKSWDNGSGYSIISLYKNGKETKRAVHQLVAEAFLNHIPNGNKLVINHINFDKSDNRLVNLEIISHRKNCNKKHIKSSSEYVGVYYHKTSNKFIAQIQISGKSNYLGCFINEHDAHKAYKNALNKL